MLSKNGNTFVVNPSNNGSLIYAFTFRKPKERNYENELGFHYTDSVIAFLSNRYSNWHECYQQLFRSTSYFIGIITRKIPLDKSWNINRTLPTLPITLIGDAAHIMPPFAGEGVNIGMLDTITLTDNLTNGKFNTIESAITDYEQKIFVYANEAQLESSKNEIAIHSPDFSFKKIHKFYTEQK